jgi:hypothetical protein
MIATGGWRHRQTGPLLSSRREKETTVPCFRRILSCLGKPSSKNIRCGWQTRCCPGGPDILVHDGGINSLIRTDERRSTFVPSYLRVLSRFDFNRTGLAIEQAAVSRRWCLARVAHHSYLSSNKTPNIHCRRQAERVVFMKHARQDEVWKTSFHVERVRRTTYFRRDQGTWRGTGWACSTLVWL